MTDNYLLSTGNPDYERLSILNKHYNPPALSFLQNIGLKPGMTVLEVGCGTGHMACVLAKYVGSAGKVIAIDNSAEQIEMARYTAKELNVNNIEFYVCDVFNLEELNKCYDATYGRWVIEFHPQPELALEKMYQYLNKGGLLAYESLSIEQTAPFSYPYHQGVAEYHKVAPLIFKKYGYNLHFSEDVFTIFQKLGCQDIKMHASQAVFTSSQDKRVYSLGLESIKQALFKSELMSEEEYNNTLRICLDLEKSHSIQSDLTSVAGIK